MNAATGLAPGTLVAQRYEIVREAGRGPRSIVFEARDTTRDRRVALKLLSPPAPIAHLVREQLRRDAEALRAVEHPGLLAPHDLLEAGFDTLVVRDWIDGPDLATRVAQRGALSPHEAALIGRGIAEALGAVHARGLLHRDVKPQNVLLAEGGGAFLCDFGSGDLDGQEAPLDDAVRADPFVSPEVAERRYADARSDIYALGMTLYFALTGELPAGPGPLGTPPPHADGFRPTRVRPDVPAWLDEIVARATCAQPGDRIATADRVARALDDQGLPGGATASREAYLVDCCILCREPGTLGRSVCPHCEDPKGGESDTLIMLVPPEAPEEHDEGAKKLRGLTGSPSDERSVRRVARGKQPLVKLSRSQAQRVARRLESHGFETRLVAADATWAELPDWLMTLALVPIGLGFALALMGDAVLFGVGVAGGLVLLPLGHSLLQHAPLIPDARGPRPSPRLAQKVAEVMPEITGGEARRLLAEVLRLSRDVSLRLEADGGHGTGTGDALVALGLVSCDAARELASLDPILDAFMLHGEHRFEPPPGLLESRARVGTARSCLVQGLLEATATLSTLRSLVVLDGAEVRAELDAVLGALSQEVEAQRRAVKEAFSLFPLRSTPEG